MSGASQSRGGSSPWDHPELGSATPSRRFLIQQCLGRGGFGEVYRATMSSTGGVRTEVAIKVLRSDLDAGSDSVRRLRDEGRLLGALSHPSILRVHDLVLLESRVALVTEYVEGEDLDTCLAADPRIPIRCLLGVLGEVASALDVAWNAPSPQGGPMHLVHRDVKPANIRLGRHGEVKLLDFGIARATNLDREAQTANNAMLGSYLYMAPERYHEESVAPPSDMYALGCILFEGLTGNRLFDGMTLKQIYGTMLLSRKLRTHLDERLKLVPADTPEGVRDLMLSLLEPDPDARPVAKEVARKTEDLAETLAGPTLKRWARSREWAPPAHIVGSLDGRELAASSFENPPLTEESPFPVDRTPGPGASVSFTAVTEMLPLPSPGGSAADAPVPGLVTRPNVRPSPEEIARARVENQQPEQVLPYIPDPPERAPEAVPEAPPVRESPPPAPAMVIVPAPSIAGPRSTPPPVSRIAAPPPIPDPTPIPAAPRPAPVATALPPLDSVQTDTGQLVASWFAEGATDSTPAPFRAFEQPTLSKAEAAPPAPPEPVVVAPPAPSPPRKAPRRPEIPMQGIASVAPGPSLGPVLGEVPLAPEPIPGLVEGVAIDDDQAHYERTLRRYENRRQWRIVGTVVAVLSVILLAVTAAILWYAREPLMAAIQGLPVPEPAPIAAPAPVPAPPPPPAPIEPAAAPPAPTAPTEIEVPQPTPPAVPAPKPKPAAKPAPKPKPKPKPAPKPSGGSTAKLIESGWNKVDNDASGALAQFQQALSMDPRSAEAQYGRGYALMRLSRKDEAVSAYCKAIALGDTNLKREIRSVMQQNGLSCP